MCQETGTQSLMHGDQQLLPYLILRGAFDNLATVRRSNYSQHFADKHEAATAKHCQPAGGTFSALLYSTHCLRRHHHLSPLRL